MVKCNGKRSNMYLGKFKNEAFIKAHKQYG